MMTFFLLVTANVGSIFEDPNGLLKIWVKEFLATVQRLNPKFIALHCQEFGGKNYEESMSHVDEFVRALLSSQELLEFENRVFLDEDFSTNDKFTALGNLYFVHKSQQAYIWDFKDHLFIPVVGKEVHSGNIEYVTIKDKLKFPQEFFPEFKWSRKGFMKTRWLVNGVAFDMINIHLFHDESNFISISDFPSNYTKNRRKALEYTLNLINKDSFKDIPLFIFGDFNFRLDTQEVIKKLTNCAKPSKIKSKNGDLLKLIYHDSTTDKNLFLERKQFYFSDQSFFSNRQNISWLLEHDKELSHFDCVFSELEIGFPPSYPFKEEITSGSNYMNTRCPSWCDRILMNHNAKKLISNDTSFKARYELMGINVPMGDHKPVYLICKLPSMPEPGQYSELCSRNILLTNNDAIGACNDELEDANTTSLHCAALSVSGDNNLHPNKTNNSNRDTCNEIQSSQANKSSYDVIAPSESIISTSTGSLTNAIDYHSNLAIENDNKDNDDTNNSANIYIKPALYPACTELCNGNSRHLANLDPNLQLSDSVENVSEINNNNTHTNINIKKPSNFDSFDNNGFNNGKANSNTSQSNSCDRTLIDIPKADLNAAVPSQTSRSVEDNRNKSHTSTTTNGCNNNNNHIQVCPDQIDEHAKPKGSMRLLHAKLDYSMLIKSDGPVYEPCSGINTSSGAGRDSTITKFFYHNHHQGSKNGSKLASEPITNIFHETSV